MSILPVHSGRRFALPVVSLKYVERPAFKVIVFVLCGYECIALTSKGKVPTLSEMSNRPGFRWVGPVLVGGLATHIYRYGRLSSMHPSDFHADLAGSLLGETQPLG